MFTRELYQLLMVKQTAWGAEPVSPSNGILVAREASAKLNSHRNPIQNPAVFADTFEREFALGNWLGEAALPIVPNLNSIGHYLKALCGSDVITRCVYQINVTAGGSGFTSAPAVGFTGGGGGTGAAATAVIAGGVVTAVIVTANGNNYTADPGVTFTGGGGSGATATAVRGYVHKLSLTPTLLYYLFEGGIPTGNLFNRLLDLVVNKLSLDLAVEGIMKASFDAIGSGLLNPATAGNAPNAASIQPSAAEVTGSPIEYANMTHLEAGTDPGTITDMKISMDRKLVQKRPTGAGAKATGAAFGMTTIATTLVEYYESDARAAKARAGTLTSLQSNVVAGLDQLQIIQPEVKLEPVSEDATGEAIMITFQSKAIRKVSAETPVYFNLINTVATYP